MTFHFKDFEKTSSAGLDTIVRVANAWAKERQVTVLNVETLKADQYYESGIRLWYRVE